MYSLFSKSLERFAFYNDSANLAKIKTHLDSLKAAIDAPPPVVKQLTLPPPDKEVVATSLEDENNELMKKTVKRQERV